MEEYNKRQARISSEAFSAPPSKSENTHLSAGEKSIPPKNEHSEEISEIPSVTILQPQRPQQQERQKRKDILKRPLRRELGLYQAITSRNPKLAQSVVIPFGLLSFLILNFFASLLSGAFSTFVVQNPTAWLFVSFLPWVVLSASSSFMVFSFARDNRRVNYWDRERSRERREGSEGQ